MSIFSAVLTPDLATVASIVAATPALISARNPHPVDFHDKDLVHWLGRDTTNMCPLQMAILLADQAPDSDESDPDFDEELASVRREIVDLLLEVCRWLQCQ